jgi:pyrroloquinoline quinone biosynthesis protein E
MIPKKFLLKKIYNLMIYYLSRKFKYHYLFFKPIVMDIEPTTGCNFRCTMCQVSSENFVAKNLDLKLFKKVIVENQQLIKIKLQGMGEPLINKNFHEMVSFANKFGIAVEFVTNGSLLTRENINKLSDNLLSTISISIDGATKETFENIRVKSNFDVVIANVKNLINHFKSKKNKTEIKALSLIQKKNFHEIENITKICKDLGFDNLAFQVQMTGWGKEEWENINKAQDINYSKLDKDYFLKILKKYNSKSFKAEVITDNILSFKKQCSYPYENPYLSANGKIVPCCMIADDAVVNFGSVSEYSFSKIWNSKDYQDFRKGIKQNIIKNFCKNCYKEFRIEQ